jgi:PAS domain S-box-containing protein
MEETLSPKRAKSRTRGRKGHLSGAKTSGGRGHKTRADPEQQLKACKREIARTRERLAEAIKQQTATSEVMRIISSSPTQSVLDAVAENAARLCEANNAEIFRLQNNLLHLVASYGEISVNIRAREGLPATRDRVIGRATCDRRTIQVRDLAAEESEFPVGSRDAKRSGHRTTLATPLLCEGAPIGVILMRRWEIRPFSAKQIALLENFANQAVIAIENARLFEAEKQRSLALAQANRDLAEREAKIRRLVDANIIGIFIWEMDGRVIEANDAFLGMIGYDRADLASGLVHRRNLTPLEWSNRDERTIMELKTLGSVPPFEKEYYRKDGSRVPVLVGLARFEEGGDEGVAFVVDLTERKRAEEALRESEAKFHDYAETASDWLWEIGPDYKFTLLTGNAFGSDPADRIGTPCWAHALDLETEPEKWRLVWATLDSREPFRDFVYCAMGGNGSPMYVKASGKPVFDTHGEFRGYRGTGTDVTAIVRVERAESRLVAIISSSSDAIIGKSLDGIVTSWNTGAAKIFGYEAHEMIGQSITRIIPAELRQEENMILGRLRQGDRIKNYETVRIRKDGSRIDISLTVSPVFGPSGKVVGASKIARDITAEKRAEAELQLVREELARVARITTLGQLTASIAHEITQPIASSRNNAGAALNFLDQQPLDLTEVKEALVCVVADADRAGDILGRIRDQIKKAPPRKDRFDLNEAINEVITLARSAITKNEVSVETHFTSALLPVQGDRIQLQQVVLNLVLNAVDAMSSIETGPRELVISAEQSRTNGVLVAVRDTGPGIDAEHRERVFEAFYTTKSSGVGMGPVDMPVDHRCPWGAAVGKGK